MHETMQLVGQTSIDLCPKCDSGTGNLRKQWGQLFPIQLHQGTKVKAHQPTHLCAMFT